MQLVRRGKGEQLPVLCRAYLLESMASPASQVVKGPSVPTYGSPACWPAGLAQLPGAWRDAGRWCSLLIFGPQHAVHSDTLDLEESPDDEMMRAAKSETQKHKKLENEEFHNAFKSDTFEMNTPGSLTPNG